MHHDLDGTPIFAKNGDAKHTSSLLPNDRVRQPMVPMSNPADSENNGQA